jgi:hypothetical protein
MKLLSLVIASALGAAASGAGLKTNIESASQLCNLLLQLQQKVVMRYFGIADSAPHVNPVSPLARLSQKSR